METNNIEMITKMVIDAINKNEDKGNGFVVPIGVSARHIHLTQEHVEALFGEGYQLTKKKDLMGGQFASNETVTIVGLKLRAIENVRILGPVRSKSQVEVSATDAIKLGMKVPVRMSGDLAGSAPIAIVGPKGAIYLKEGCIVAMRHIHMAPKDAQAAGVHDGDVVSVKADNERGTIFNQVKIRVDDSFTLEMHIDTDEANAAKNCHRQYSYHNQIIFLLLGCRFQASQKEDIEKTEAHMIVGKVVGSIVSTRKSEKLIGNKFMIVEPVHHMKAEHSQIVAIDIIGAGIGEYVLVAKGSAARIGCGVETAPVDAAIVGIVDDGAGLE